MYTELDSKREEEIAVSQRLSAEPYRGPYRRDYARLLHAPSFRRLQGKTQLFPGQESDFFRNRLTHSLEVAQIAESIAYKLNYDIAQEGKNCFIDVDLVRFACLAHDLGHPPFGHLGEEVLNRKMLNAGGFEGNAQTLHIVTKLEKRNYKNSNIFGVINNVDYRLGLNLTYRSLASILKYDSVISEPNRFLKDRASKRQGVFQTKGEPEAHLQKGYYACDKEVVDNIKRHVAPGFSGKFKSVECALMDVADDIAYSTYDLEDSLKGGFLTPLDILSTPLEWWHRIVCDINESLHKEYIALGQNGAVPSLTVEEAIDKVRDLFDDYMLSDEDAPEYTRIIEAYQTSKELASDNHLRTDLTSYLAGRFVRKVKIELNPKFPALSKVYLDTEERKMVEILKRLTWEYLIRSHKLKIVAHRGSEIVGKLFDALNANEGYTLLPDDFKETYLQFTDPIKKKRVICDFIAGMTDKYAIEFYGRLFSENPATLFKPV